MSYFCFSLHYLPAVPYAPTLAVAARLYELQLNCSFGGEAIYCNVTIEVNGTMMPATGNSTFYGLVSNTLYPTSARAINRCGDYSETSTSHWTCKFVHQENSMFGPGDVSLCFHSYCHPYLAHMYLMV